MKAKLMFIFLFGIALLFSQRESDQIVADKLPDDIKILSSEVTEEVKIEIRKPDEASFMPQKATDYELLQKRKLIEKIKKSNKMLY